MGLLRDAAFTALGYGIAGAKESNIVKDTINKVTEKKGVNSDPPLWSIVEDYARAHGIYGQDNNFYRELLHIAEKYRDPFND